MPSSRRLNEERLRILRLLERTPFDQALPIVQGFGNLTFHAGIYGIKSIENTVLYVGKASAFRTRFQVGHQALNQMFIDGLSVASIRLITVPIGARFVDDLLTIEKGIIFVLRPRYNKRIPLSETLAMQTTPPTAGRMKELLRSLPDPIVEAIEDHADTYGLSDEQVLELAIARLLNVDAVSLSEVENLKGVGELAEENAILRARLKALGQAVDD